jgi:hypothetical protein
MKTMKFLINLFAKISGAGKILGFLDGKKAYIGGGGLMLLGAGMVLVDLVPVLAAQDAGALFAFVQTIPSHPGVQKLLEGFGITGLRHAFSKASEPAPEAPKP